MNFADQFKAAGVGTGQPTQGQPFGDTGAAFGAQPEGKSALGSVQTGTTRAGTRTVIAGVEKIGKTTLACTAPRALLIPLEMGFGSMPVAKTKLIETYAELMATLREVKALAIAGKFQFMSLILDSATAVEQRIHEAVLRTDKEWAVKQGKGMSMETALGGYGKAYAYGNNLFAELLTLLDELAFYGGVNILFTAHVFPSKMQDPQYGEYDQWDLLLHSPKNNRTYGKREMITQWADMVGFLHEPAFITKDGQTAVAASLNRGRVLAVDRTPAYVAGNRYGITGTIPIPLQGGRNAVAHAIYNANGIDYFNRD